MREGCNKMSMTGSRRAYVIYGLAAALIAASWFGNIGYNRYYQLPEGRFLQHHIEATDTPYVAFDLLYVANKGDKRSIRSIRVAELPTLDFYPGQMHQELHRQTIYKFTGYYRSGTERSKPLPPLNLHAVTVTFNDGETREMKVGDMIVYRNAYPAAASPVDSSSAGASSANTGYTTLRVSQPVRLIDTASAWLGLLGGDFRFDLKQAEGIAYANGQVETKASQSVKLAPGDSLTTNYRFNFRDGDPKAGDVFNMLLTQTFETGDGSRSSYATFVNYLPYYSEKRMKQFVRAQREAEQ